MKNFKNWFGKNKVLIIGLLLAVLTPMHDLISTHSISTVAVVYTLVGALIAFCARNLRGQAATILGIAQLALTPYLDITNGVIPISQIPIAQIIIQLSIAFLATVVPAAKSIGYEDSAIIKKAKQEGENIQPTVVSSI